MRQPEEKKEKIAVPDEPIKGGASSLPPLEEKEVKKITREIDGGAGTTTPVKETRERIVGGPGTYPEPKPRSDPIPELKEKKVKIAAEPEIVGGKGSIYRPEKVAK